MFHSIEFISYNKEYKLNKLALTDYCLSYDPINIETPLGSPSIAKSNLTNTLVFYSLIQFYENKRCRIPPNIARYYLFLEKCNFDITEHFIDAQFIFIDNALSKSYSDRYLSAIKNYLNKLKNENIQSSNRFYSGLDFGKFR